MIIFFMHNSESIRDLLKSFGFNPFSHRTDRYLSIQLDFETMEYCGLKSRAASCIYVYPDQIAAMVLLGSDELRKLYVENCNK